MNPIKEIILMHSYARPMGGQTEQQFVDRFLTPLGFERDAFRNLVLQLGDNPSTLFSSHVDTVDRKEGRKKLTYGDGILTLSEEAKVRGFSCLGADDTAGIWLMLEMIRAGVPGVYVIHHGEESGCIGSGFLSTDRGFFEGITKAVAFDRAGTDEIITHQARGRTASDEFAEGLSQALAMGHKPSPHGVYTDTNEYAGVVAECTNVAVGYARQHSQNEWLDVPYLIALRDRLLTVDWEALPVAREPGREGDGRLWGWPEGDDYGDSAEAQEIEEMVAEYPGIVASLLMTYGLSAADVEEEIYTQTGGRVRRFG